MYLHLLRGGRRPASPPQARGQGKSSDAARDSGLGWGGTLEVAEPRKRGPQVRSRPWPRRTQLQTAGKGMLGPAPGAGEREVSLEA